MLQAWLDGAFVPMSDAKISAFDAGFQHGIGLFETMAARHGRIFRGLEHMERMSESARMLGLSDSLRAEALVDAAEATLAENALEHARIRVTLTGGDMNLMAYSYIRYTHDKHLNSDI
jgi:branched-chain amino acid aminotransferase